MFKLRLAVLLAAIRFARSVRLTESSASSLDELLAGTMVSGTNLCDRELMVQYRGKPDSDSTSPVSGSFRYKAGEWKSAELYRKKGTDGCEKTYVAKCEIGSMEVTKQCQGETKEQVKTKCLAGWSCWRSSYVSANKNEDDVIVYIPGQHPLDVVAGVVTSGVLSAPQDAGQCAPVQTQPNFDVIRYISKPWYVQQQMPTQYLPVEKNYCVQAKYTLLNKKSFWGYDIQVRNVARDVDGILSDSGGLLLAYSADKADPAKLGVAPYFVPKAGSGDYWVLAYDEEEGYAVVSGGQPTVKTAGGCTTGEGINDSGLWLFTRARERDDAIVQKMRSIAQAKGLDLSVLHDVDQKDCGMMPEF